MSWDAYFSSATLWTMLVGAISNTSCALLGCYLVLRRQSLLGDAISHAVLPGLVLAYLWTGSLGTVPIVIGAMATGLLTTFLTESLRQHGNVPEDASMGVVFTSLFALGVVLIAAFARDPHIDDCVLYGLIEFVSLDTIDIAGWEVPRAMISMSAALALVVAFVLTLWKELKIVSFDPQLATAMGLSAGLLHYALMAMVALVTVTSFEAVGSILVIAMLIVPAATAQLLTDRLRSMLLCAVAVGGISAVLGTWIATWLNTSVAGMMAVVVGAQFALAVVFAPRYGALSKAWHALQLTLRILGEDVLATLYRQEEKSRAPATVTTVELLSAADRPMTTRLALWQLRLNGQIAHSRSGSIELNEKGRAHAQSLVRAHRLWESFLEQQFDLPLDHLHEPAERIEHYLGPELLAQVAGELTMPQLDPHGRAIPTDDSDAAPK